MTFYMIYPSFKGISLYLTELQHFKHEQITENKKQLPFSRNFTFLAPKKGQMCA